MYLWFWHVFCACVCVCVCVFICMFSPQVCCRRLVFVSRVHGVFYALMFALWCVFGVCGCGSMCVRPSLAVCIMLWITSRPCFWRDRESLSSRGVKPQRKGDCHFLSSASSHLSPSTLCYLLFFPPIHLFCCGCCLPHLSSSSSVYSHSVFLYDITSTINDHKKAEDGSHQKSDLHSGILRPAESLQRCCVTEEICILLSAWSWFVH